MKKISCVLLLSIVSTVSAARGGEVTINFDDLPENMSGLPTPLPFPAVYNNNEHATFSTEPGAQLIYFSEAQEVGTSPPNTLTSAEDPNDFPYSFDIYVDFTKTIDNLTFTVSSDNDSGVIGKVRVYHAQSVIADVVDIVGDGNFTTLISVDLSAYEKVSRIEIVEVTDTFGLSYDDFNFFPVPEPAAWSLMIFSACALVVFNRIGLGS
jgi:hypothetical protein